MPRYRLTIPKAGSWQDDDFLVLRVGTLDAADLDNSTPAGGTEHARWRVGDVDVNNEDLVAEFYYDAAPGTCGTLPIGVAIEDVNGNLSAVWEYQGTLNVRTAPIGVGRPAAAATESANEARLTWEGSESIEV